MGTQKHAVDIFEGILAIMRIMRPRVDAAMSAHGLSLARGKVLSTLLRTGPSRPGTIASKLGLAPRTLTDSVDALERDGLLMRQPHPSDRRAQLLALTDAGRAALAAVDAPRQEVIEEMFGCLDEAEKAALASMLQRVAAASVDENAV